MPASSTAPSSAAAAAPPPHCAAASSSPSQAPEPGPEPAAAERLQAAIARSEAIVPFPEYEAVGLQLVARAGMLGEIGSEHANACVLLIEIPLVIAYRFKVVRGGAAGGSGQSAQGALAEG